MISLYLKTMEKEFHQSSKPIDYIKALPIVERNIKRESNFMKVQSAYKSALFAYISENKIADFPLCFLNPNTFFVYYNRSIHYIYDKSFDMFENVPNTFWKLLQLPCTAECQVEIQLLDALTALLKRDKALPKYKVLLNQYEETYRQSFPIAEFFLLEGTLCFWHKNSSSSFECIALNQMFFQNISKEAQKFWKNAIPILKAMKSGKVLLAFTYSKLKNPYYMHMKISDRVITIKYNETTRTLCTYEPKLTTLDSLHSQLQFTPLSLRDYDISHFFHYVKHFPQIHKGLNPTDELTRFLFAVTNGNYRNLVNLSILFANISSPELLTPKLFVISYTSNANSGLSMPEYFRGILDLIFNAEQNPSFSKEFPSINKIVMKKYIPFMLNNLFQGTKILFISKGSSVLSEPQRKVLCQLIKGSKINSTDLKFGSVSFRNSNPIICFSNNHKEIAYMEQNLPCIRIDFDFVNNVDSLCTPNPNVNIEAFEWLRTCLPLYGLYMLAEKSFHHQPIPKGSNIKTSSLNDNITNEFLSTCCIFSPDDFVYTDELYNVYTTYYKTVHKSEPLKRTQLINTLKQIPGLIYKRPHISRSKSNKYAFVGIRLKADWEICISSSVNDLSLEEETFKGKLQEITDLTVITPV